MGAYIKYAFSYTLPEYHNIGFCNQETFLAVNSAGIYYKNAPLHVTNRPSGRNDYYLSYHHAGTLFIDDGDTVKEIKEGHVFIYKPNEPQCYRYLNDGQIINYWVHFTGYGADELLRNAGMDGITMQRTGIIPEIGGIMESMIDEMGDKSPGWELSAMSAFIKVLSVLSRALKENLATGLRTRNTRIHESLAYIKANLSGKLSIQELAAMSYLSTNRYSTVFKELLGISPQQYIIHLKLQKAIQYMHYTNMSVGEIAVSLGFGDQLYFSRLFKKYMHLSPRDFMTRHCRHRTL